MSTSSFLEHPTEQNSRATHIARVPLLLDTAQPLARTSIIHLRPPTQSPINIVLVRSPFRIGRDGLGLRDQLVEEGMHTVLCAVRVRGRETVAVELVHEERVAAGWRREGKVGRENG